jgi:hypothetical protein
MTTSTHIVTVTKVEQWKSGDVWITYTGGGGGTILMRPALAGARPGSQIEVTLKLVNNSTWKELIGARLK